MGGPGFVLSRYFNKFACKVGYLMVTRKVIALICLSRVYFSPLKCYQRYHKSILWLTKAHQLLLVGLLTHITLRPGLFSFNFFFLRSFYWWFECTKKNNNIQGNNFRNKKRPMSVSSVSVCPRSLNKRLQKHRENHLRYVWRMWIHSIVGCPLRQGWYKLIYCWKKYLITYRSFFFWLIFLASDQWAIYFPRDLLLCYYSLALQVIQITKLKLAFIIYLNPGETVMSNYWLLDLIT